MILFKRILNIFTLLLRMSKTKSEILFETIDGGVITLNKHFISIILLKPNTLFNKFQSNKNSLIYYKYSEMLLEGGPGPILPPGKFSNRSYPRSEQ